MPQVVAEVLRLMEDRAVDVMEVGAAIERDPAMAGKILRLANSAHYGLKRQVGSVRLALVVLGMREVRNVLLGMSAFDVARGVSDNPIFQEIWHHSLEVAAVSKKLATELRLGLQGEDFVGGLLHDVGKAVLLRRFPEDYARVWRNRGDRTLVERERDAFGCSHAEIGAALMQHWALPEGLVDALWYHHVSSDLPLAQAKDPALAAVVRLANLAAHDDLTDELPLSKACGDNEAWLQIDRGKGSVRPDTRYNMLAPFRAEVRQIPILAFD